MTPCPEQWRHTPAPTDYAALAGFMQVISRTHEQGQCGSCRRWVVWRPRNALRGVS